MDHNTLSPAEKLIVQMQIDGTAGSFPFQIDNTFQGAIRLRMPNETKPNPVEWSLLGIGISVVLGQLCLAKNIILDFPVPEMEFSGFIELAQLFYDVRNMRDCLPLFAPQFSYTFKHLGKISLPNQCISPKKAFLLFSGGKDSLLSHILLDHNAFDVIPLHFTANFGCEASEYSSSVKLANLLQKQLWSVVFSFENVLDIGMRYSNLFNVYPIDSPIPHGRDLILTICAVILANHHQAEFVCFGHEQDLWTKTQIYNGRRVYRHDMQSEHANTILQKKIVSQFWPHIAIFSPIAGLKEYRILKELFILYPGYLKYISSCFWGNWCGECPKCLRYSLAQELYDKSILTFRKNPLDEDSILLNRIMQNWSKKDIPYSEQILYTLSVLVERGFFLQHRVLDAKIRNEILSLFRPRLPKILESLEANYPNSLAPAIFDPNYQQSLM